MSKIQIFFQPVVKQSTTKLYLILSLFVFCNVSCRERLKEFKILDFVDIHKRFVISKNELNLFIADNKMGYYSILWYSNIGNLGFTVKKRIILDSLTNIFPVSISSDNSLLSIESWNPSQKNTQLSVVSLNENKIEAICYNEPSNKKGGVFSPTKSLLAFISQGALVFYNFRSREYSTPLPTNGTNFLSLAWSSGGKFLFLIDDNRTVWRLCESTLELHKLITIPGNNKLNSIQLTPIIDKETDFFFISNHQTTGGFNQIFYYENEKKTTQLTFDLSDKSISERPASFTNITFRFNENGRWKLKDYQRTFINQKIQNGVVYDYYKSIKSNQLFVIYSDNNQPCHLAKMEANNLVSIHNPNPVFLPLPVPKATKNSFGMYHLVYKPLQNIKSWVLWLHGGPNEQVSYRYNNFFSVLLNNGHGLIVLNYPGSIGIGSSYELSNLSAENLVAFQKKVILNDLQSIRRRFEINKKINLLGISYGSILAHELSMDAPNEFAKLIDFSGIHSKNTNAELSQFYIYGDKDYILSDIEREEFIKKNSNIHNTIILQNEGHFILNKNNNRKAIQGLLKFLE